METKTFTAFTTEEASNIVWTGYNREEAGESFAKWLGHNLEWVSVGLESEAEVIEIVGVSFDLVDFNRQVLVAYLCEQCESNECEANNDAHETTISRCSFVEDFTVVSQY